MNSFYFLLENSNYFSLLNSLLTENKKEKKYIDFNANKLNEHL